MNWNRCWFGCENRIKERRHGVLFLICDKCLNAHPVFASEGEPRPWWQFWRTVEQG